MFLGQVIEVMGDLEPPQREDLGGELHGAVGQDQGGRLLVAATETSSSRWNIAHGNLRPLLGKLLEDIGLYHMRDMKAGITGVWLQINLMNGAEQHLWVLHSSASMARRGRWRAGP